MKKLQLVQKLEASWYAFEQAYAGLSPEQMLLPGVTGDWSIKEILVHVSIWEAESLKHLPDILEGRRPARYSVLYGGIDAFNALMAEQKRSLSLYEVQDLLASTHRQLIEYLLSLPAELFTVESRFRRRLRLDTYSHYPIHTRAIWAWREQTG
ncbi:MAG: hypothetical protein A2Z16_05315 [Chloroflexi bacterium RBG_16_54_18]|nr:MAG: hypothetical protein A2Z16_05315 [Chloroflexi bacterium RBG_16_54_18]